MNLNILFQLLALYSNSHAKDSEDDNKSGLQELHTDESVLLCFPVAGHSALQTRAVILIYDASYRILERLVYLHQVLNACLNNLLAPLVDLVLLILYGICPHNELDC